MGNLWWLTPEGKAQLDAENRALDERAAYDAAYQQEYERIIREAQAEAWEAGREAAAVSMDSFSHPGFAKTIRALSNPFKDSADATKLEVTE